MSKVGYQRKVQRYLPIINPSHQEIYTSLLASSIRGQTEETRRTTVLQQLKLKAYYRNLISMKKKKVISQIRDKIKSQK